jgi:hypothetical protein
VPVCERRRKEWVRSLRLRALRHQPRRKHRLNHHLGGATHQLLCVPSSLSRPVCGGEHAGCCPATATTKACPRPSARCHNASLLRQHGVTNTAVSVSTAPDTRSAQPNNAAPGERLSGQPRQQSRFRPSSRAPSLQPASQGVHVTAQESPWRQWTLLAPPRSGLLGAAATCSTSATSPVRGLPPAPACLLVFATLTRHPPVFPPVSSPKPAGVAAPPASQARLPRRAAQRTCVRAACRLDPSASDARSWLAARRADTPRLSPSPPQFWAA